MLVVITFSRTLLLDYFNIAEAAGRNGHLDASTTNYCHTSATTASVLGRFDSDLCHCAFQLNLRHLTCLTPLPMEDKLLSTIAMGKSCYFQDLLETCDD